ncbi:MAG: hypothetical protein P4L49_08330 [Desulfosporosinus sp.]|nr:hypothetical protein [Desulfosporosinus sp.]
MRQNYFAKLVSYIMKKLLISLSKLRLQTINGTRILFPLTKDQKTIYKALNVDEPV